MRSPATTLLVLALAATAAVAQSQKPPEPPTTPNEIAKKEGAGAGPAGKEQPSQPPTPVTVTVVQGPPTPDELRHDSDEREKDRAIQKEISNTTRGLLWLGIAQGVIGVGGLLITLRAANAAKQSADVATAALHMSERAYVGCTRWTIEGLERNDTLPIVRYRLINNGRTPATLLESGYGFSTDTALAEHPKYHFIRDEHRVPVAVNIPLDLRFAINHVSEAQRRAVLATPPTLRLWFWGYVKYEDRFKDIHTTGFLVTYEAGVGSNLVLDQRPGYNYSD